MKCPKCGAELKMNQEFCENCGAVSPLYATTTAAGSTYSPDLRSPKADFGAINDPTLLSFAVDDSYAGTTTESSLHTAKVSSPLCGACYSTYDPYADSTVLSAAQRQAVDDSVKRLTLSIVLDLAVVFTGLFPLLFITGHFGKKARQLLQSIGAWNVSARGLKGPRAALRSRYKVFKAVHTVVWVLVLAALLVIAGSALLPIVAPALLEAA